MVSLKKCNIYFLMAATSVIAVLKNIGVGWIYKVKADDSHKGQCCWISMEKLERY